MQVNDNSFNQDLKASTELQRKYNRKEYRRIFGGKHSDKRSNAPRCIASRKPLPMPENWKGWRNWKPVKKVG